MAGAELVLMEVGDFWMMRKELRSIRDRAELETSELEADAVAMP